MTLSIAIQNDGVTSKEEVIQSSSYPALIRLGMTGPESIVYGPMVDEGRRVTFADRWRCSSAVGWRGEVR